MIQKVMFFSSDWNSSYDFYGVYYKSGRVKIYNSFETLPKTVRKYIANLHHSNPEYIAEENLTAYTFA